MESRQSLSRRRRAVENIGAVTKAMEVVAAVKMRKSQEAALGSRPYAFKVLDLLEKLSRDSLLETSFMRREPPKNTLVVLITSDRGLIGSFNTQILRTFENFLAGGNSFVAVGKKAEAFLIKKNLPVLHKFYGFGDFIDVSEIEPLSEFIIRGYERGDWDRVLTFSMHFRSALRQEALVREILPLDSRKILETVSEIIPEHGRFAELEKGRASKSRNKEIDYIFEPSQAELLNNLMPHLLKMQIYHLILEANASEHAARYVSMKNASDNAAELSETLLIQYNKARQAAITGEIIEISATQNAMK